MADLTSSLSAIQGIYGIFAQRVDEAAIPGMEEPYRIHARGARVYHHLAKRYGDTASQQKGLAHWKSAFHHSRAATASTGLTQKRHVSAAKGHRKMARKLGVTPFAHKPPMGAHEDVATKFDTSMRVVEGIHGVAFGQLTEKAHNPFPRFQKLGNKTPAKDSGPDKTQAWSCSKAAPYRQRCTKLKEPGKGRIKIIKVSKAYKAAYNHDYKTGMASGKYVPGVRSGNTSKKATKSAAPQTTKAPVKSKETVKSGKAAPKKVAAGKGKFTAAAGKMQKAADMLKKQSGTAPKGASGSAASTKAAAPAKKATAGKLARFGKLKTANRGMTKMMRAKATQGRQGVAKEKVTAKKKAGALAAALKAIGKAPAAKKGKYAAPKKKVVAAKGKAAAAKKKTPVPA